MDFTIKDRITLMISLPSKGTFNDLILRKDVLKKIELTQEELEKYKIKSEGNGVTWEPTEDKFPIEFSESEKNYVRESLKELDKKKEAQPEHLTLWELFK